MGKKWFPLARKSMFPLTGMHNSFKNTFLIDGKIKLAVAEASENQGNKWFPHGRIGSLEFEFRGFH